MSGRTGAAAPPTRLRAAQWPALGTTARLAVTNPELLPAARREVVAELAAIDRACSRFRPDSEVRRLELARGRPVRVSPLLAEAVACALEAARQTDGDVDPTVGAALVDLGYDRDFAELAQPDTQPDARPDARAQTPRIAVRRPPGWREVHLDRVAGLVTVPPGTLLDLGATAKAWAADRCARRCAEMFGCGVLVSLGGDIATAGPVPADGWCIRVQDRPDRPYEGPICTIVLPEGGGLATSSTISRQWRQGPRALHHIIDPRTCQPTPAVWRTATVAAPTCVTANTASTAALVRGPRAVGWLRELGLPARLVAVDGTVVTLGGWPPAPASRPHEVAS